MISFIFLYLFRSAIASNVKYVNPIIGTDNVYPGNGNYAGMIPTTGTPFAMTRFTAMTFENVVGTCPYVYTDNIFYGFLATHQPAQWMGESAEIVIAPGIGDVKTALKDRGLTFSHDDEVSSPQYYKTVLTTSSNEDIIAELSSTSRAGSMRFTFDTESSSFVVIQATRTSISGEVNIDVANREVYGWNPERQDSVLGPFTADDFKGYFVARFEDDFLSWGTANNSTISEGSTHGAGDEISAYVTFPTSVKKVNVKIGLSFISIDQARVNMDSEVPPGVSLEETASFVENEWAKKLDLVHITNASEDELAIFYTAMYHALQVINKLTLEINNIFVIQQTNSFFHIFSIPLK
jgi:putative alpha-1,2-mannosidase